MLSSGCGWVRVLERIAADLDNLSLVPNDPHADKESNHHDPRARHRHELAEPVTLLSAVGNRYGVPRILYRIPTNTVLVEAWNQLQKEFEDYSDAWLGSGYRLICLERLASDKTEGRETC